jgi:hypothetical protein
MEWLRKELNSECTFQAAFPSFDDNSLRSIPCYRGVLIGIHNLHISVQIYIKTDINAFYPIRVKLVNRKSE